MFVPKKWFFGSVFFSKKNSPVPAPWGAQVEVLKFWGTWYFPPRPRVFLSGGYTPSQFGINATPPKLAPQAAGANVAPFNEAGARWASNFIIFHKFLFFSHVHNFIIFVFDFL